MSITFYSALMSSATPVTWALAELQVPHESVKLDLSKGDQKKPEFLALNPNGKVPTLPRVRALAHDGVARSPVSTAWVLTFSRLPEEVAQALQLEIGIAIRLQMVERGLAIEHVELIREHHGLVWIGRLGGGDSFSQIRLGS